MLHKFFIPGHPQNLGNSDKKKEWNRSIRRTILKVVDGPCRKMNITLKIVFVFDPRRKRLSASRLGQCISETLRGVAYENIWQISEVSYKIRFPDFGEVNGAYVDLDISEYEYADLPKFPCQWPRCKRRGEFGNWACKEHWKLLPDPFRESVIKSYVEPLKKTGKPGKDYEIVKAALDRFVEGLEKSGRETVLNEPGS